MKERIRELASGQVEFSCPAIAVSMAKVEELKSDSIYKAAFWVESVNGVAVKGVVYSSHNRVSLSRQTFFGRNNEIHFEINTNGLSAQSVIEGGFTLVTNAGVYKVPFSFVIEESKYGEQGRTMHEMADFTLLLQEDPQAAYHLFRSKQFSRLPIFTSLEQVALYQTISCDTNVERAVEEFLSCVGQKNSLEFTLSGNTTKNYTEIDGNVTGQITICKNTWGWGELTLRSTADFVTLSDTHIFADQFINDRYTIEYTIHADLLAVGTNLADIIIASSKGDLVYRVCVAQKEKRRFLARNEWLKKQSMAQMTALYTEYRRVNCLEPEGEQSLKQLDAIQALLQELREENPDQVAYTLMLIYSHLLKNRPEDADALLDEVRESVVQDRLNNVRNYCFYLYLRARFTELKDQMETAAALINKYYTEGDQDPLLLFLLMEADGSIKSNKSLVVLRMKELFKNGCRSPLLYLTACEAYREQPDLLRVLNSFELQAVYYGARKDLLTEEMASQIARAAAHELQYKPFTCRLLTFLYKKYPTEPMLQMLCSYLIRSKCSQKRFFPWYEQGVTQNLNIQSLYEYYMYCLPDDYDRAIPQEVLLYFTYSNHMQDEIQEKIYENVLKFYEPETSVYRAYAGMMEEYALSKLLAGRISRKLVPLYRHLVFQEMIDERLARVLPNLLVAHEFTCANTNMKQMVLRYPELNFEDNYPLEKGVCCAPVFAENCMVFFVDADGCRYCDVPYRKERIFDDASLLKRCEEVYPNFFMFRLRRCCETLEKPELLEEDVALLKEMMHVVELHAGFKNRIVSRLLDYNLQKDDIDGVLLAELDLSTLKYNDRRKALECMIRIGNYDTAYQYIRYYGLSGVSNESLLVLVQNLIKTPGANTDTHLIYLSLYLFLKECYSPATLAYLTTYYDGPSDMMRKVLAAGHQNQVNCYDMAERILAQKLFSGDWSELDEIFRYYTEDCDVHELMERAYYVVCAYRYFVKNEAMDEKVFMHLERACMLGDRPYEQIDLCNIALLYYYSFCEYLPDVQLRYCEELLSRLCKKGLMFGFYGKLWAKVACPAELNGKYLLEHRSNEAKRVFLQGHFAGEEQITTQKMQEMYTGIFVSQVVLFSDEVWTYSIIEETEEGSKTVVKDEVLSNDMSFIRQGSVFETVNLLGKYASSAQDKRLEETMIAREATREIIKKLFDVM